MKITKSKLREIVKEELKNASHIARRVLREDEMFRNQNSLFQHEWEEFKENFLSKNRDHKVRKYRQHGKKYEAIVKKSDPKKAVIKYIPADMTVMHDMKGARFFDYIR